MKKLFTLLLCAGILFTTTACDLSTSGRAIRKIESAINNMKEAESAAYSAKLTIKKGTKVTDLLLQGEYNLEKKNPDLSLSVDVTTDKETIQNYISIYLKDAYFYVNLVDIMKQKTPIEIMKENEQAPDFSILKKETTLSKEDFLSIGKRGSTITLECEPSKVDKDILKVFGLEGEVLSLNIVANVSDGYISNADIQLSISQKDENDKKTTSDITMNITFENFDEVEKVTFPDLTMYQESTNSNLLPSLD